MKDELLTIGLGKQEFIKHVGKLITNDKENAVLRKWAFEFISAVYSKPEEVAETNESDALMQASLMISNN